LGGRERGKLVEIGGGRWGRRRPAGHGGPAAAHAGQAGAGCGGW